MDGSYKVLARKYRPQTFAEIIGQDAMVRVMRNSFQADRIAHAFILTGVRGVGKTTTARLIAKGLNCVGSDGDGGPTTDPCGKCEHCLAIADGRHVDVLEMDAASRTGVADVREIIESVAYRAATARHKVYIIDEVHMLSNNAFNALLKTLEEPPEHVKFVFATTEIRMVPVTVLSRCQRFDLRRVRQSELTAHLRMIAEREEAKISDPALALIIRASEGSVRDAVSLLDQAMSLGESEIDDKRIREMLALADRGRILDLLERVMEGDAAGSLNELRSQYDEGADPQALLRDLAEAVHWISVIKMNPEVAEEASVGPEERERGLEMSRSLPASVLARAWQMLVKSLDEARYSPTHMMAAEMAMIRLTHVAELPTPFQIASKLEGAGAADSEAAGQDAAPVAAAEPEPAGRAKPGGSDKTDSAADSGRKAADAKHPSQDAKPPTTATKPDGSEASESSDKTDAAADSDRKASEAERPSQDAKADRPSQDAKAQASDAEAEGPEESGSSGKRDAAADSDRKAAEAEHPSQDAKADRPSQDAKAQASDAEADASREWAEAGAEQPKDHALVRSVLDAFPGAQLRTCDAAGKASGQGGG